MLSIVTGRSGHTTAIGDEIEITIKMVIGHQVWFEVITPENTRVYRKPVKQLTSLGLPDSVRF